MVLSKGNTSNTGILVQKRCKYSRFLNHDFFWYFYNKGDSNNNIDSSLPTITDYVNAADASNTNAEVSTALIDNATIADTNFTIIPGP